MDGNTRLMRPDPIVDKREEESLGILSVQYNKLTEPSKIRRISEKCIPPAIRTFVVQTSKAVAGQELFKQSMEWIADGFSVIEGYAAKFSINEKAILQSVNKVSNNAEMTELDEICFARSYHISRLVNKHKFQDTVTACLEGAATGAFGFWGLPFNLVLSTFLYFRAVQSIAMYYGYDVRNDREEMVIASGVFVNAMSPSKAGSTNEVSSVITKIMMMTQASIVKEAAGQTWSEMIKRGGIPLLLAQMRALANKAAQKALEKAGAKGLENSIFKEVFEQIGKKLTLKTVQKSVPFFSSVVSALIDTAQMNKILEYADIFYHKRFILEKEGRINAITG